MKKRSNQILSLIGGGNVRDPSETLEKTISKIKENKKILIIDELNKLQDPKIFFDDLNTIYRETGIPIIVITNNPLLMNMMEEDARLTLLFSRVDFRAYNAHELVEICKQRIKLITPDLVNEIEEATIFKICAYAAKSGSARRALGLIKRCIMERKFKHEDVDSLVKAEEFATLQAFISSLNEIERSFLSNLVDLNIKKIQDSTDESEEIYITPREIQESLSNLGISKISQLITTFENDYGFITTTYIIKGRAGGRYRRIEFTNHEIFQQLEAVL